MGYRDTTVIREGPPGETVLSAQQPATEGRKAAIIHPRNPDLHPGGGGPFCYCLCGLTWVPRDSKEFVLSELLLPVPVPKLSPTVLSRTCQLDHISRAHSRVWPQRRWCEAGSASQLWRPHIYQKQRLKRKPLFCFKASYKSQRPLTKLVLRERFVSNNFTEVIIIIWTIQIKKYLTFPMICGYLFIPVLSGLQESLMPSQDGMNPPITHWLHHATSPSSSLKSSPLDSLGASERVI